jgi:hypothetical protein
MHPRQTSTVGLVLALTLAVSASEAGGQARDTVRPPPVVRVRLLAPPLQLEAELGAIAPDSVHLIRPREQGAPYGPRVVRADGTEDWALTVSRDRVDAVGVRGKPKSNIGAGALLGGLIGLAIGRASDKPGGWVPSAGAPLGVVFGVLGGAVVGAMITSPSYDWCPLDAVIVSTEGAVCRR